MDAIIKQTRRRSAFGRSGMILVFGKNGQVGRELAELDQVVALDRVQADLSDPTACANQIQKHKPTAVINAAAFTAVDQAETEEDHANLINGIAPAAMAQACQKLAIPLVHISSDYVFDGLGTVPWRQESAANPINAYGRSKLLGEQGIIQSGAVYAILRTSWVVSAYGTNFVKSMLRASSQRKLLNVVNDQIGGPTPAADIAQACVKIAVDLSNYPEKQGIYHLSGYPDVTWYDFAKTIFDLSGRDVMVTPIPSAEYPTPAPRPKNSRLNCAAVKTEFDIDRPSWMRGLHGILTELGELK